MPAHHGSGSAFHSAGHSNVGHAAFYESQDQKNEPQSVINERNRYKEGQHGSHQNLDSKDERSIANKLAAEENRGQHHKHGHHDYYAEGELSKMDPTKPASLHGHQPSKGAQVDRDLQQDDEKRLEEKGLK
ncbi:hypothetical protein PHISCL_04805 [Aspergillus sclerotialis]|uniref:Uncharacterized protein n=1 Tax=Aspergillus sclerotialis TaxID=2070753 RepID=A0A3A2ZJW3_9EURO|nr:hypothetical protein PHISCL_04805 [Aspergillus sclerotialis]